MNRIRVRPCSSGSRVVWWSVGAACLVTLLAVGPSWAQLETPGLRDAYLLEPCQFLFNSDASTKFKQVLGTDQHYLVHEHIEDFIGGHERWDYHACSLEAFVYEITDEPAGVFYLDTIGTDPQAIASLIWTIYAATTAGQAARNEELQHDLNVAGLTALDVYPIDILFNGAFYPAVAIRPSGLAKIFHGTNALVYINASWGNFSASTWPGSRARLGYSTDIDVSTGVSDANTFFGRLNGEFGKTLRSTASAVTGTSLVHSGLAIALSPTVVGSSFTINQILTSEAIAGWFDFDCPMDETSTSVVVGSTSSGNCLNENDPGACTVVDRSWSSPTRIQFTVKPTKMGTCQIKVRGTTKSGGGRPLDGNQNPTGSDGQGPAEDDYVLPLFSRYCANNAAASFAGAWAWKEDGNTRVAWLTDAESEVGSFLVYAIDGTARQVVATIAPLGSSSNPHYYETAVLEGAREFQVVERTIAGTTSYGSPYLKVGQAPSELAELRAVNDRVAAWSMRPADPTGPAPSSSQSLAYTHFVYYSSRQDFLDATAPVRTWWLNHGGFTSQTILGSSDPNDCRAAIMAVWEEAVRLGTSWYPILVIVGEANQGSEPNKNIVGTFYPSDGGTTCFSTPCGSDVMIVDFDGDKLPDTPWSRIVGYQLGEIQNSVGTALEFYNNVAVAPAKSLFLDGDLSFDCQPLAEPHGTITGLAGLYSSAGIPNAILHESTFACGDYPGRYTQVRQTMAAGITELCGIGNTTNRILLPGYFLQKLEPPNFNIGDFTVEQRIVGEFPTCLVGDCDRNWSNPALYPSIAKSFLTADPAGHTTAVAWLAHMRGGYEPTHFEFARRYFARRLEPGSGTIHQAYFDAIRDYGTSNPEACDYLLQAGAFGWPVRLPGMTFTGVPEEPREEAGIGSRILVRPNPLRRETTIQFAIGAPGFVGVDVFDASGRKVRGLMSETVRQPGLKTIRWDRLDDWGHEVTAGMYFVRVRTPDAVASQKMVVVH